MNIYNPLQYTGKSFTSSVKETFQQQEAKKQASIERMNETLRTQAAQGRLGSLANSILNDALTQASEQGLIGVNQYDVMNQAMPKFYAAKSAVTELNNAFNAELEAAKADDRINVDANYLKYLNEKFYGDGNIELDDLTSHAANAVNKGFDFLENREFLNYDVIGKSVVDQVGDLMYTERTDLAGGEYFITTVSGKRELSESGVKAMMQSPDVAALVLNLAGKESKADVSPAEAKDILNDYISSRSKSSRVEGDVKMTPIKEKTLQSELAEERSKRIEAYGFYLQKNDTDKLAKARSAILNYIDLSPQSTPSEAVRELKRMKDKDGNPVFNATYLDRAVSTKDGSRKQTAAELLEQQNKRNASLVYDQTPMETVDDLLSLKLRDFGDVDIVDVQKTDNKNAPDQVVVEIRISDKATEDVIIELDEDGKPTADSVNKFKNVLVSQAYGDSQVRRAGATTTVEEPPVEKRTLTLEDLL